MTAAYRDLGQTDPHNEPARTSDDHVIALLFDLTQQSARFGVPSDPWRHLPGYDTEDFALFPTGTQR